MNPDVLSGAVFNGLLVGVVGWLLNDKLKMMESRIKRIESVFFKSGIRREECDHNE